MPGILAASRCLRRGRLGGDEGGDRRHRRRHRPAPPRGRQDQGSLHSLPPPPPLSRLLRTRVRLDTHASAPHETRLSLIEADYPGVTVLVHKVPLPVTDLISSLPASPVAGRGGGPVPPEDVVRPVHAQPHGAAAGGGHCGLVGADGGGIGRWDDRRMQGTRCGTSDPRRPELRPMTCPGTRTRPTWQPSRTGAAPSPPGSPSSTPPPRTAVSRSD